MRNHNAVHNAHQFYHANRINNSNHFDNAVYDHHCNDNAHNKHHTNENGIQPSVWLPTKRVCRNLDWRVNRTLHKLR